MDISQKNVFGDNVVTIATMPDRKLTDGMKSQIISALRNLAIDSVSLHYEYDGETTDLAITASSY